MQVRLDFAVSKEKVNILLHNCVLKIKTVPMSSFFSNKKGLTEEKRLL